MLLLLQCHTIHMQNGLGTSLSLTPFLSKQAFLSFPWQPFKHLSWFRQG